MLRIAFTLALLVPASASAAEPDAKAIEFFENKIRPVLVEQCLKCHSMEAEKEKKLRGGLKLDTKAGWDQVCGRFAGVRRSKVEAPDYHSDGEGL